MYVCIKHKNVNYRNFFVIIFLKPMLSKRSLVFSIIPSKENKKLVGYSCITLVLNPTQFIIIFQDNKIPQARNFTSIISVETSTCIYFYDTDKQHT